MNNYGFIFRNIRESKKMSLKEVADGVLSVSLLSKFERGENDITLSKFYMLLNKINLSFEEFSYIVNGYQLRNIDTFLNTIKDAYETKNEGYLEHLMEQELTLWNEKKIIFNKLNAIMICAVLKDLNEVHQISIDDVSCLTDYLFSMEDWGLYELTLFGNSLRILNIDTIIMFSKDVINKISIYKNINNILQIAVQVLINIIILCLENGKINEIDRIMAILDKKVQKSRFYYERIKIMYLKGVYLIKKGNIEEGKHLAETAIDIMHKLDEKNLAMNHQEYLDSLLSKAAQS